MVADAAEFFAILDRFPGVRGVLWGHVHQQVDRRHGAIQLMASPSTCVQFAPGSVGFKSDALPPGYRWLDLHEDGSLHTGVSRVHGVAFTRRPGFRRLPVIKRIVLRFPPRAPVQ